MNEGERDDGPSQPADTAVEPGATKPESQATARSMIRGGQAARAWIGALLVAAVATFATSAISTYLNAQGGDAPERLPEGTFVGTPVGIGVFLCVGLIAARHYRLGFALGPLAGFALGGFFIGLSFLGPFGPLIVPVLAVLWGFYSWALPITFLASVAVGFLLMRSKAGRGGRNAHMVAAGHPGERPVS